ncbi:MAG TPA: hypothetical protein VF017_02455 [Thermoanaerobaculia bacterium]|nr:hypothetical protein [Thermoanaerobaculia bacterium]
MRSISLPSWIERLLGLSTRPVPPHVFAVDEGRLSYARFERSGGGFQLTDWRSVALAAETFQEGLLGGPIREPRVFTERLGELLRTAAGTVKSASLVLPDAWLRIAFTEGGQLPKAGPARDEVLRWKLKRLVPYRVEELRISASELETPAGASEQRLMLAFALEALLAQLEDAFAAHGVTLGQITSTGLAALAAAARLPSKGLVGLTLVGERDHTMLFAKDGEPVLFRFKSGVGGGRGDEDLIRRDLRLTRSFLEEQFGGEDGFAEVCVLAPPSQEASWVSWLSEELVTPAQPLHGAHLVRLAGAEGRPLTELVPMLGAAALEVA